MSDQQAALEALPPSAKLALLHAQASNGVEGSEGTATPEEPAVPCADDPVVVDNSAFAEPIIAGDLPMPIGQQSPTPAPVKEKKRKEKLDLSSETAFPSLSAVAPRAPITSAWSASAASRVKSSKAPVPSSPRTPAPSGKTKAAAASSAPPITDILELPANQQIANLTNKPLGFKSSADVIQQVMSKTGTNIIASTNRSGTTTFLIQGPSTEVARAKRELVAGLVVKRTVEIGVPASTRRFIIGTRGKNLQQIEAKSGVRINFPRKDDEAEGGLADDDIVKVTLVGDAAGISIAKAEIDKIVSEKAAKQTAKVESVDPKYYLLLAGPKNQGILPIEQEYNVKIQIPHVYNSAEAALITVTGDKEKVQLAIKALEEHYAQVQKKCGTASYSIPKRQHKYFAGKDGATIREILEQTGCTIELPAANDPSEDITIRGPDERLIEGLSLVMTKARAVHLNVLNLADMHKSAKDQLQHGRIMLKYLVSRGRFSKIEEDHNVQIGVPQLSETEKTVAVEFVSKSEQDATAAYKAGYEAARALVPELVATVDIPSHLHRHIAIRHARQLKGIKAKYAVEIFMPDEEQEGEIPTVAIVYEGNETDSTEQKIEAAKKNLEGAVADLKKIADDSSDFVSKTLTIPAEYHRYISGPKNTTLNAILGSETSVSVRFGGQSEDAVTVRGPVDEVNKAITQINKIHEAAQRKEYVDSYSTEFEIPAAFSAHVIGKAGTNINKLKEELGVKIDISDPEDSKSSSGKKGKNQQVKVVIQGVQFNVLAAKERIQSLVANLADQVTLSINVPREYHRYLIGPNGRYVRKLEEKYNVYVRFPKSTNGSASPDPAGKSGESGAITIRGRKKDASSAKEELLELYEYEKEEQAKWKEREALQQQRMNEKKAQAEQAEKSKQ